MRQIPVINHMTLDGVMQAPGRRPFPDDGTKTQLELADVTPTMTGVLIATYRRVEQ